MGEGIGCSGCGDQDDDDFDSIEMCCHCGGGTPVTSVCSDTNNGALNKDGYPCDMYKTQYGSYMYGDSTNTTCGATNDDDFDSNEMCCYCGGGLHASAVPSGASSSEPSSIPSGAPTGAPTNAPQNTTCRDLKAVYQNNTCCGENTTNPATFTNTPTTCGAVLSSYKTSACCSEFESKSAVMNF